VNDQVFRLSKRAALESEGDEYVLVDTHSASLCSCNATAWRLLTALTTGATLEQLATELADGFDIDAEIAHRDVLDFVGRLGAVGLIDDAA